MPRDLKTTYRSHQGPNIAKGLGRLGTLILALSFSEILKLGADNIAMAAQPAAEGEMQAEKEDGRLHMDPSRLRSAPRLARPPKAGPMPLTNLRREAPSSSLIFGLGFRGTRSETSHFDESLGAEAGVGLPWALGTDVILGVGKFLAQGSTASSLRWETGARTFLLAPNSGPYLGIGWAWEGRPNADAPLPVQGLFGTLGLFGGDGIYAEFDFRGSHERLVAAIFEVGFRLRLARESQEDVAPKGPLARSRAPCGTILTSAER